MLIGKGIEVGSFLSLETRLNFHKNNVPQQIFANQKKKLKHLVPLSFILGVQTASGVHVYPLANCSQVGNPVVLFSTQYLVPHDVNAEA